MLPDPKSSLSPIPKLSLAEEDDDLDDLDDVLDKFSTSTKLTNVPAPPPNTSALQPPTGRPRQNTRVDALPPSLPGSSASKLVSTSEFSEADESKLGDDFAKELARGMESFMRELGAGQEGERPTTSEEEEENERLKAFKAVWEAALLEGPAGDGAELDSASAAKETPDSGTYQDRLKQAMNKIKEGESKLQSSSGSGSASTPQIPPDFESLLRSLGDPNAADGEPGEEEKELIGFLETMMNQLMSKEVLYEPLKELSQGFPSYLANPPTPLPESDIERFKNQQSCIQKILTIFDSPGYKEDHPEYSKEIVELMSEMQTYGSPPPEIMGALPPGFEGLDKLGGPGQEGCIIS